MDYPNLLQEIITLSIYYLQNIQGLSNNLTLDDGWINLGSTCPTFVLTLTNSLEVQGVS